MAWLSHPTHLLFVSRPNSSLAFGVPTCSLTWWVATIDLGPMNNVIMLTIAVTKATLVALVFMHVKYSNHLTWAVIAGGIFWLLIMLALTMNDYLTRAFLHYG